MAIATCQSVSDDLRLAADVTEQVRDRAAACGVEFSTVSVSYSHSLGEFLLMLQVEDRARLDRLGDALGLPPVLERPVPRHDDPSVVDHWLWEREGAFLSIRVAVFTRRDGYGLSARVGQS